MPSYHEINLFIFKKAAQFWDCSNIFLGKFGVVIDLHNFLVRENIVYYNDIVKKINNLNDYTSIYIKQCMN